MKNEKVFTALLGVQCWASKGKLDRITALKRTPRLDKNLRGKTQMPW